MISSFLLKIVLEGIETGFIPDFLTRWGIRRLNASRLKAESRRYQDSGDNILEQFITEMDQGPIAPVPEKANEQHYELPPDFFKIVLGKRLKYSSCFWPNDIRTLDEAEEIALQKTCEHAQLKDGVDILELGCGWGSLSLWMAEHFPNATITAVSNSTPQRIVIEAAAAEKKLANLNVITADMNDFHIARQFDRIVSVEMFEHMRNYRQLLHRISGWLKPEGNLFIHIFCHKEYAYLFETEGPDNWMGRFFFSGGMMPSDHLLARFQDDLKLEKQWCWDGAHYQRTAEAWLANMDDKRNEIMPILAETYGVADARKWFFRWRVFFMACAELFGYQNGQQWWVSHYLFKKF